MLTENVGALARGLTFATILLVVGAWVAGQLLRATLLESDEAFATLWDGASRLRRRALGVLAGALVLRLALEARAFAMPDESPWAMAWTLVTQVGWGRAWVLEVVATGLCALRLTGRAGALPVALLTLAPALMGHAIATESARRLAIGADWLHVLASGVWMGTLGVLVLAFLPRLRQATHAPLLLALVRRFSPIALSSAALVGLTGTTSAALHLPSVGALWSGPYGRLVLGKAVLFAALAALGAVNWKRATPRLEEHDAALLHRAARAEVAVAVLVVAVTSVLVATAFDGT